MPVLGGGLQWVLLFGIFFVSLWFVVDLRLIYHGGGVVRPLPEFYWGWDFARDCLSRPGGPADYLAAMFAQSLYYSWFGALVLTGQAVIIFLGLRGVLKALDAGPFHVLAGVPVLIVLGLYCRYAPFFDAVTSLAIASAALLVTSRLVLASHWMYAALLLLGPALLYFIAPGGVLLYACMTSLGWIHTRPHRAFALLPWFSALVTAVAAGEWVFGLSLREASATLLPVPWDLELYGSRKLYAVAALYLSFPASTLPVLARRAIGRRRAAAAPSPAVPPGKPLARRTHSSAKGRREARPERTLVFSWLKLTPQRRLLIEAAAAAATAMAVVAAFHDRELKTSLAADYYAWHRQWPQALAAARHHPDNAYLCSIGAQAAFHSGTLTQELPVMKEASDLLLSNEGSRAHWRRSDLYLDLGYVNMALHHLTEAVEFWGERPILLRRLALANLALGNEQTARLFLGALTRVPFHSGWARKRLKQLEADPTGLRDDEVQRLKNLQPKKDLVLRLTPEEELTLLLEENGRNRMAFEYLMTHFLLTRNLDGFLKNISRLNGFAGFQLPALWEDALVLAAGRTGRRVELNGYGEAQRRLEKATQIVKSCAGNKQLMRERLREQYAQTYFYYYFCR